MFSGLNLDFHRPWKKMTGGRIAERGGRNHPWERADLACPCRLGGRETGGVRAGRSATAASGGAVSASVLWPFWVFGPDYLLAFHHIIKG